jgi:hypothetical protein
MDTLKSTSFEGRDSMTSARPEAVKVAGKQAIGVAPCGVAMPPRRAAFDDCRRELGDDEPEILMHVGEATSEHDL